MNRTATVHRPSPRRLPNERTHGSALGKRCHRSMRPKRNDKLLKPEPAPIAAKRSLDPRGILLALVTALFIATPLVPSEATVQGAGAALHVLWMLALLGWSAILLLRPGTQVVFGWTGVAATGLIALCVGSSLIVGMSGNGRHALNMLWQWMSYGVSAFLLRQLLTSAVQCRALLVVMAGLAVVESVEGYHEYFVSGPAQRAEFQADPERFYRELGAATTPHREQLRWRIESVEPLGTFALTNSLAGLLAPWLIVVLGIGLALVEQRPPWRLLARTLAGVILGAVLIAGCLLLTKSRTAVLAGIFGGLLLALYGHLRGWRIDWKFPAIGGAALLLIGLGAVAVGGLDAQVVSEAPLSVLYRVQYWQSTAAMIADNPLFGVGPGNFQEHYARYALPQASELVADPHNFLLELWATAGTLALVALFCLAGAFAWQLSRAAGSPKRPANGEGVMGLKHAAPWPTEAPGSDGQRAWVYAGGVLGLLAGYPLGILTGHPLEPIFAASSVPVIWVLGLPVAGLCAWLLDPWVRQGELPAALPVIALITLLTNLLAAGSIGFPGVFSSAWLLMALALAHGRAPAWRWAVSRQTGVAMLLAAMALSVACIQTEFSPVVISTAHLQHGNALQAAGRLQEAEEELLAATRADPWTPEAWRALASLRLHVWLATQQPADLAKFDEATAAFVARDPKHHTAYGSVGDWHLVVWRRNGDRHYLERAIEAYALAAAWYPNKARQRAQLAWALHLAGRNEEALVQAEEALRLDRLNPHSEKKLAAETLVDPQIEAAGGAQNAEQMLRDLRSRIGPEREQ